MTRKEAKNPHTILILKEDGTKVKIQKEETDPIAYRISLGGRPDQGYYFVFRGDIKSIDLVLKETLEAWKQYKENITK